MILDIKTDTDDICLRMINSSFFKHWCLERVVISQFKTLYVSLITDSMKQSPS
jgi:hypothetical protein